MEVEARKRQEDYNDDSDDPMVAMLYRFLDLLLPADWSTRDLSDRRRYLREPDPLDAVGVEKRTRVCAAEFICEVLGRDISDKEFKYTARRVNKIIGRLPNWEKISSTRHAEKLYGVQRGFRRVEDLNSNDEDI